MKLQVKNNDLYQLYVEINNMQQQFPLLYDVCKAKVKQVRKTNDVRYSTLSQKLSALQNEFFVIEDKKIKTVEKGGKQSSVFQNNKNFEDYQKKLSEIMNEPNVIVL